MKTESQRPLRFGFPAGTGLADLSQDGLALSDRVAAKILHFQAQAAPARPFVYFAGTWVTYGEADERANRVANALGSNGIAEGDRVGLFLRNRLEYLDLWFGLSRLGAIQVPINTEYRVPQLVHLLRRAPIKAVVIETDLFDELIAALREASVTPPVLLTVDDMNDARDAVANLMHICATAPSTIPETAHRVSGASIGAVMNTSGTTGPSKGVLLTHAQQYVLGRMLAADMELNEDDVFYNFFPLFHNTSQAMVTIPVLLSGARMVITEKFSASRFWSDIQEHNCTAFYYIGEILRILLRSTPVERGRKTSLRVGWGIGASAADFIEFRDRSGITLRTGYGSTEANVPCYLPHDSHKSGSAGRPAPGFEIRIADASGSPLPQGVEGEILVRSSEPCALMAGYDGDPTATVEAWKDLWFHSGDAGMIDEDGDLYFKGRIKDAIRVRGENISAFEVEQVLARLEGVAEIAAIAVPSDLGGDELKVVIVRSSDSNLTEQHVVDFSGNRLPRYSIPRYVEFVTSLPKTPTNKIQKHVLRKSPFGPTTWDAKTGSLIDQ